MKDSLTSGSGPAGLSDSSNRTGLVVDMLPKRYEDTAGERLVLLLMLVANMTSPAFTV